MEDVPLNDAEGLRRRPTRTQSGSRVDEYKRAPDLVQRAPSLRRTKSGTSVASPPEIARVRSFGVALSKRSRKLRRRLRRRYNRAAEAFELLHRAQEAAHARQAYCPSHPHRQRDDFPVC